MAGRPDAEPTDSPPLAVAEAIRVHVAAPTGPLRLLVGETAATYVSMALELRRDDYRVNGRFTWPT